MAKRQQVSGPRSGTQLRPTARPIETYHSQEQPAIEFGGSRGENIKSAVDSINKKVLQPAIAREQEEVNRGQATEVYEINSFLDAKMEEAATKTGGSNGDMTKPQAIQQYQGFVNEALANRAGGVKKLFAKIAGKKAYELNAELDSFYTEQGYDTASQKLIGAVSNEMKAAGLDITIPIEGVNWTEIANVTQGGFELYIEQLGGRNKAEGYMVDKAEAQSLAGNYSLLPFLMRKNEATGGTIAGKSAHAKKVAKIQSRYLKDKEEFQTKQQKDGMAQGGLAAIIHGDLLSIEDKVLSDGATYTKANQERAIAEALEKSLEESPPKQIQDADGSVNPEKKIRYMNDMYYGKYSINNQKWTNVINATAASMGQLARGADQEIEGNLLKTVSTGYALWKSLKASGKNNDVLGAKITDETEKVMLALEVGVDHMGKTVEDAAKDISTFTKGIPRINLVKWEDDKAFTSSSFVSLFGDARNMQEVVRDFNNISNYVLNASKGTIESAKEQAVQYIDKNYIRVDTPDGGVIAVKTQPLDNLSPETFSKVLDIVATEQHLDVDEHIMNFNRLTDNAYIITADGLPLGRMITINQLKRLQEGDIKAVQQALFDQVREDM